MRATGRPVDDGRMVTTVGMRIERRLTDLGLSQSELARRVGLKPTTINSLVRGSSGSSKHLHTIARALDTTINYLIGVTSDPAEGAQLPPTPSEIAEQLDAVLIPQVDVSFAMGAGSINPDIPVVQMVPMSRAWLRTLTSSSPADLMVARGDGDSMMPTIFDQDYIIIDKGERELTRQDRIWALVYGGGGMVKRVRRLPSGSLQLNSDNAAVSSIEADVSEVTPIGRVVGIVRRV